MSAARARLQCKALIERMKLQRCPGAMVCEMSCSIMLISHGNRTGLFSYLALARSLCGRKCLQICDLHVVSD